MANRRTYEVELRHDGRIAKALRATLKSFVDMVTNSYIESHLEESDEKRRAIVEEITCAMSSLESLIRTHAMHVVWGQDDVVEEVKRLATNAKSPKVKSALDKLANELAGNKLRGRSKGETWGPLLLRNGEPIELDDEASMDRLQEKIKKGQGTGIGRNPQRTRIK